ncbi:hypothetical protein Golob_012537 [Gossypium lobatum]|uniref:Uncharacterized protein n=1 Tax=Gossypium lobatum TaxID=34289 RepID=A0A7J8LLR6_9ROSI|nr:hypothetical protein [Gossypium lobatum]
MLATLYRELCWTTELDKMSTNGRMILLQSWDAKVSLVVYATMEMHKFDQVMRQFGWRQNILPPLEDIEALHKFDLRRETDEN